MDPLLLTPEAAADALSIGRSKVFELLKSGQLESVQIGRSRRIPTTAVADYARRLVAGNTAA
jgi:excisionase family DNA binding protein